MHVSSLLCANEGGRDGGMGAEAPHRELQVE